MDKTLLINQYSTSPDEKLMKMNVKTTGISIIILAWLGSPGEGVIFCCNSMVAPITRVNTGIPKGGSINGIEKSNLKRRSGADRSLIHPKKGACLSSMD